VECAEALRDGGADLFARNNRKESPYSIMRRLGRLEMAVRIYPSCVRLDPSPETVQLYAPLRDRIKSVCKGLAGIDWETRGLPARALAALSLIHVQVE